MPISVDDCMINIFSKIEKILISKVVGDCYTFLDNCIF
jgi:hypothetical protein